VTQINRRSLITGLISLVAAPAIVRAGSLMPVKQMVDRGPHLSLNGVPIYFDDLAVKPVYFLERFFWVTKLEPTLINYSDPCTSWGVPK
jgi:hypothetical protein